MSSLETAEEKCAFCLDDKKDPLFMCCGHSFCAACFDEFKQSERFRHNLMCPICKTALNAEGGQDDTPAAAVDNCIFCLDTKTDPVFVQCGHSFCFDCFERFKYSTRKSSQRLCPLCRTVLDQTAPEESGRESDDFDDFDMADFEFEDQNIDDNFDIWED